MKFIQDMESCTERCFLDHRSFVEERSDAADFPVEELYNWNRDGTGMDRPFTQSIPESIIQSLPSQTGAMLFRSARGRGPKAAKDGFGFFMIFLTYYIYCF